MRMLAKGKLIPVILIVLPPLALYIIAFIAPIANLSIISFQRYDPLKVIIPEFTADNYLKALTDPYLLRVTLETFKIGAIVSAITLAVSYPVAYFMVTLKKSWQKVLAALAVLSPLMTSLVITSYAWIVLLGREGIVNQILTALFQTEPMQLLYNEPAVILGLVYSMFPFMCLSLHSSLEAIDKSIILAAKNLGASPSQAFIRVTLPLSIPGITAGFSIVFTLSISSFMVAYLLGARLVKILPIIIYDYTLIFLNWPLSAAMANILLVIILAITVLYMRALRRRRIE